VPKKRKLSPKAWEILGYLAEGNASYITYSGEGEVCWGYAHRGAAEVERQLGGRHPRAKPVLDDRSRIDGLIRRGLLRNEGFVITLTEEGATRWRQRQDRRRSRKKSRG
jgi:hypothetical protein